MIYKLVMLWDGKRVREIKLGAPELVIGRGAGCKLRISANDVSRQHCRVRISDDTVKVRDLGSSNGTYVNGDMISGERAINVGDRLRIGRVTFVLEDQNSRFELADMADDEVVIVEEVVSEGEIIVLDEEPTKHLMKAKPLPSAKPAPAVKAAPKPAPAVKLAVRPPQPPRPAPPPPQQKPAAEVPFAEPEDSVPLPQADIDDDFLDMNPEPRRPGG